MKNLALAIIALVAIVSTVAIGQAPTFVPVTDKMLVNPSPDDWLMYSRTYDAQRYSPLKEINRENVAQLQQAFVQELGSGNIEGIPIVYRGVMYLMAPGAVVKALDATNGAVIKPSAAMIYTSLMKSGSAFPQNTLALFRNVLILGSFLIWHLS